jgi:hypothetical protein
MRSLEKHPMKVIYVQLDKTKLLGLPEPERSLFLGLGHVANEINALTKMLYWAAGTPAPTAAQEHGRFTMMLLLTRLLAGKLNESWGVLQKSFYGTALSKQYAPMLEGEPAEALGSLGRYFGSTNAANVIRNRFAFHDSPADLGAELPEITGPLLVYMDRASAPNNLFYMAELLLGQALIHAVGQIQGPNSLEDLVGQLFDVSLWFSQVADGIMDAIMETHGQELRAADPEEVRLSELMDFRNVTIPWFTETTGALADRAGSSRPRDPLESPDSGGTSGAGSDGPSGSE